jgi:hypothetical protein
MVILQLSPLNVVRSNLVGEHLQHVPSEFVTNLLYTDLRILVRTDLPRVSPVAFALLD